jgi:serine/threonine-protein kinase mTOR
MLLRILPKLTRYSLQTKQGEDQHHETAVQAVTATSAYNLCSTSDDYLHTIVINALLGMLKDRAFDKYHDAVVGAVMSFFKTQGLRCVASLP